MLSPQSLRSARLPSILALVLAAAPLAAENRPNYLKTGMGERRRSVDINPGC